MDAGPSVKVRVKRREDDPEEEKNLNPAETPNKGKDLSNIHIDIMISSLNLNEPNTSKTPENTQITPEEVKTGMKRRQITEATGCRPKRASSHMDENGKGNNQKSPDMITYEGLLEKSKIQEMWLDKYRQLDDENRWLEDGIRHQATGCHKTHATVEPKETEDKDLQPQTKLGDLFAKANQDHIEKLRQFEESTSQAKRNFWSKYCEKKPAWHEENLAAEKAARIAKHEVLKECAKVAARVAKHKTETEEVAKAVKKQELKVETISEEKSNIDRVINLLEKASLEHRRRLAELPYGGELKVENSENEENDDEFTLEKAEKEFRKYEIKKHEYENLEKENDNEFTLERAEKELRKYEKEAEAAVVAGARKYNALVKAKAAKKSEAIIAEADEYNGYTSDDNAVADAYIHQVLGENILNHESKKNSIETSKEDENVVIAHEYVNELFGERNYELSKLSSDDSEDDSSEDETDSSDDEESLDIYTITPRRCCAEGARRLVIIAEAKWPILKDSRITPKLMVVDKYDREDPKMTKDLLNQPPNWEVNKNSLGVWTGTQKNRNIRFIENSKATIQIYLENEETGMKSKLWRLKIETCVRQDDPKIDCLWCCKEDLEWIDGHPNGWLEGANQPDLSSVWDEDIEVLEEPEEKCKEEKMQDAESAKVEEKESTRYQFKDITWPRTMEEYKDTKYPKYPDEDIFRK